MALGDEFGSFITKAEIYVAAKDPHLQKNLESAVGRARGPRYKVRSTKQAMGCCGNSTQASSSKEVRCWSIISGQLQLLAKLRNKNSEDDTTVTQTVLDIVTSFVVILVIFNDFSDFLKW